MNPLDLGQWKPGPVRPAWYKQSEQWRVQMIVAKWCDAPCAYSYNQMMAIGWASR